MLYPTDFAEITRRNEPLAPLTWLKIGGPAEFLATPRSVEELQKLVQACRAEQLPVRLLGGGSNLLIADEGVRGVVIRLSDPAFAHIRIEGTNLTAGAGALLSHVVSQSVEAGLAGLETLVGVPGTLGGALHGNAGGRGGEIGDHVVQVRTLDAAGQISVRREDELVFEYRCSSIRDLAILDATFSLTPEPADQIAHRMKKLWVLKKASQPLTFQSAGCIFKNPRGLSAGALIEQAGLKGQRVGDCEVSDRHANFIVTGPKATAVQVRELISLMQSRVREKHGVDLELEIQVWP